MSKVDEKYVFSGRNDRVRRDILTRLKPNRVREGTFTGPENDGKTPFLDVFERYPDEPYIVTLAYAIVESWMVTEPVIFEGEYFVGFPRPQRDLYEHFSWGIVGEAADPDNKDPRFAALRDRILPLTNDYKTERGYEYLGVKEYDSTRNEGALWAPGGYQGHTVPNYRKLMRLGLSGIMAEIDHYDSITPENSSRKKDFYRACRIIIRGISDWMNMYADHAEHLAETAEGDWHDQLLEIAENCRAASWKAPETLREAGQLMWSFCLWDWVDCIGRFDQYMFPFFKGTDEDRELIAALVMKFWEHGVHNMTLSGVKPEDGTDATNEITYIALQVLRTLHETHPRMSVRVNENTPQELLDLVVTMWSEGMSDPTVASDWNVIEGLTDYGVTLEDARDYTILGCQEVEIPGKSNFGCEDGVINLAKIFEYTLNHGRDRFTGYQIGLDLGGITDYHTFDELWDAFVRETEYINRMFIDICNRGVDIRNANVAKLVKSTLTEACLERGLNLDDGGSVYNYGVIETAGHGAVGDSLYAMKRLVYDEGKISLEDLDRAIAADFEGYEDIRRMLLGVPKYGNNDEGADEMSARVLEMYWTEIGKYTSRRGQPFTGACSLLEGGVFYGANTWALPDGRHKGEPLGNTIGPRTGSDRDGLTAMLSSVAKMPLKLGVGGSGCNVLIPTAMTKTYEMRRNIASLMKTFLKMGGQLAQITTASVEDMKDAQIHPEAHEDLIVRVGGFSMKFIEFDRYSQDEFIMRYGA